MPSTLDTQALLRNRLIGNYAAELSHFTKQKTLGIKTVSAAVNGTDQDMDIDVYIQKWQDGLDALKAGADPELFNY